MQHTGVVVWFNEPKGFGFIKDDSDGQDVYVDYEAILRQGFRTLNEGETVSFELAESKGGPKAANVVVTGSVDDRP